VDGLGFELEPFGMRSGWFILTAFRFAADSEQKYLRG
jgi:hypothetical protein